MVKRCQTHTCTHHTHMSDLMLCSERSQTDVKPVSLCGCTKRSNQAETKSDQFACWGRTVSNNCIDLRITMDHPNDKKETRLVSETPRLTSAGRKDMASLSEPSLNHNRSVSTVTHIWKVSFCFISLKCFSDMADADATPLKEEHWN